MITTMLSMMLFGAILFVVWPNSNEPAISRIFAPLKKPYQRVAFIFLSMSVAILTAGIMLAASDNASLKSFDRDATDALFDPDSWEWREYWPIPLGFYSAIIFLFPSYLDKYTVEPLIRWIKSGSR